MILAICRRLYVWAQARELLPLLTFKSTTRAEVELLVERELRAIRTSIVEHYRYQDREARILNDRLSRRYDPGQAVNEAAKRAVEAKQAAGAPSPDNLTAKQQLALEVQQAHLRRVIRDS